MRRPINLAQLTPLRRGVVLGLMRARQQSQKQLRAMVLEYDTELADLEHRFREIATEYHRTRVEAAIDEAVIERNAHPGMLLN